MVSLCGSTVPSEPSHWPAAVFTTAYSMLGSPQIPAALLSFSVSHLSIGDRLLGSEDPDSDHHTAATHDPLPHILHPFSFPSAVVGVKPRAHTC